ncbi:MAG TPA: hypothetical protein VGY48_08400 [Vicinamibacterales bacterium]|jgi:hypothetical protein|nr:hypothetical protein [Vicinamibacterales bacterium]
MKRPDPFLFHIVQPYADGERRLEHATVVSSHRTAADAFAELARIGAVLEHYRHPAETLELIVVTNDRQPVPRPDGSRHDPPS